VVHRILGYVVDELLPVVRKRWHAIADPKHTIVCGSSAGGLASAFAAVRHPDVFGSVLARSGARWPGETRGTPGR
jgi:enterochelin esterase family protein